MKIKKMWFASSFASARLLLLGSRINGVVTAVRTATALYWEAPVVFVENSDVLYVDRNKKRAASLLRSIGFQMPIELQRVGSIGSVSYKRNSVNIQGENFKNVATYGDVENRQYSISREADIDSNLLLQLNEWMEKGGKLPTEGYFTICEKTPAVLRQHGALHLPIIMNESVLIKATGGKHSIALDDIAKLPHQLEHPVYCLEEALTIALLS